MPRRLASSRNARAALAWGVLLFACSQVGLIVAMEDWQPLLRDAEYGCKATRLRARVGEASGRPLVLVLGSSRSLMGICPDVLMAAPAGSETSPVVFNYACTGCGPIMELVLLNRVLREGIRPDGILLEIHPAILEQEDGRLEERWIPPERLGWNDLRVRLRFSVHPWDQASGWMASRLVPVFSSRSSIMTQLAPDWLPWGESRVDGWQQMDRWGWLPYGNSCVTWDDYARGLQGAIREYFSSPRDYRVSDRCDRASRELLDVCRREGIRVVLLTMPEGSLFQAAYGPNAHARIRTYLTRLSREYDIPWIDARCWLHDGAFHDGHHLLRAGAQVLSERLRYVALPHLLGTHATPGQMAGGLQSADLDGW